MSPSTEGSNSPPWAGRWLWAAGIYNLTWGTLAIAWPHLLFDLTDAERINYPEIWQCVGMIVGVYGIGYLIAASDSRTHWPIVLVGLLGKVFGPVGFLMALLRGTFPPLFGLTILTNDLLWWIPFAMILWDAAKYRRADERRNGMSRVIGQWFGGWLVRRKLDAVVACRDQKARNLIESGERMSASPARENDNAA